MLITGVLATFSIIALALGDNGARDYGLCSQVFQMNRYCFETNQQNLPESNYPAPRRGKAGVRGPPGIPGKDAVVDYAAIDRSINDKFTEFQEASDMRLEKCESRIENLRREFTPLLYTDCGKVSKEYAITRNETGGVFDIYSSYKKLRVFCDITTDNGRWLVFQRRMDGSVDFYRTWDHYVNGFGSNIGEFWLGLETLHQLTSSATYELRVDFEDWYGNKLYAKYSTFRIGNSESHYQLTIGTYSGNAGDSLTDRSNGRPFSTKDRDYGTSGENCAVSFNGAWWYSDCHYSNLNGIYFQKEVHSLFADGIRWHDRKGYYYSMKFTEMKMRIVK